MQGNTSTFICMGADLARRPAVTSSFSFAAPHIRAGITQRSLWRVWPSPHALSSSLLPSTATPPSALPLMLARGAAPSVAASQASPPCLILSAQAAHSCGLHTTPSSYSPSPAGPSLIRVQGLERAWAADGGQGEGQEELWRLLYQSQRFCHRVFIGMFVKVLYL